MQHICILWATLRVLNAHPTLFLITGEQLQTGMRFHSVSAVYWLLCDRCLAAIFETLLHTHSIQVEVRVVFDRPVSVSGSPRLLLDTGSYAEYNEISDDGMEVSDSF